LHKDASDDWPVSQYEYTWQRSWRLRPAAIRPLAAAETPPAARRDPPGRAGRGGGPDRPASGLRPGVEAPLTAG